MFKTLDLRRGLQLSHLYLPGEAGRHGAVSIIIMLSQSERVEDEDPGFSNPPAAGGGSEGGRPR